MWRAITEADAAAKGRMLVTNNVSARDAHGGMSHVWIGFVIPSGDPKKYGKWVTFDEGDRMIHALTHCCPIPMPA